MTRGITVLYIVEKIKWMATQMYKCVKPRSFNLKRTETVNSMNLSLHTLNILDKMREVN